MSPSTRNISMPTPGRVSEMTSRFGERTNQRNEIINPPRMRGADYAYEKVDNRYDEPIEYRSDRVCMVGCMVVW